MNSGTIQTDPAVNTNGNHFFTIGVESLPTATITSGDSSICDDGSTASISIDLTGTAPWTFHYMINGTNETTVDNIATSPYTLVVSNALGPLASDGPGNYVFNISYIRDATGSTGIRDFTTTVTITLNESPNPDISGNKTVAINENNVIYTTASVSGHTYLWEYDGPAGTTHNGVLTNNTLDMHWGGTAGSGYVKVTETVTVGGCSITTPNYLITVTDIPNPIVTGPTPVCNNRIVVYRTSKVGTHTYAWTITPIAGRTIIGNTDLDSVVVQWTSDGAYSVKVEETGSEMRDNTLPVTVNPLPPAGNTVTDPVICAGQTASVIVQAAAAGLTYQLRLHSDSSNVGSPVSSGPGGNITLQASPSSSTVYNVLVTDENTCSIQLTDTSIVTVNALPSPTITGSDTICQGSVIVYSTESGMSNYLWTVSDVDVPAAHTVTSGGGTGDNSVTVRWDGYEGHRVSMNYQDNGCSAATPAVTDIWVTKLPETGPQYHLPNSP